MDSLYMYAAGKPDRAVEEDEDEVDEEEEMATRGFPLDHSSRLHCCTRRETTRVLQGVR